MNRRAFLLLATAFSAASVMLAKTDRLSGVIKSVDKSSSTIEMRGRKNANVVRKIMFDANTQFTLDGKPAKADDLQADLGIVALGKFEGVNLKAAKIALRHM